MIILIEKYMWNKEMCNLNHNSNYCALVAVITTNTVFSIRNTSTYNLLNDRFFFP